MILKLRQQHLQTTKYTVLQTVTAFKPTYLHLQIKRLKGESSFASVWLKRTQSPHQTSTISSKKIKINHGMRWSPFQQCGPPVRCGCPSGLVNSVQIFGRHNREIRVIFAVFQRLSLLASSVPSDSFIYRCCNGWQNKSFCIFWSSISICSIKYGIKKSQRVWQSQSS